MHYFLLSSAPGPLKWSDVKSVENDDNLDPTFSSSVLQTSLSLISTLCDLWSENDSFKEIFAFLSKFLPKLREQSLHETILNTLTEVEGKQNRFGAKRKKPILKEKKKPKILKLYEPEVEDK